MALNRGCHTHWNVKLSNRTRAADADVHHVGDCLSAEALPGPRDDLSAEGAHVVEDSVDVRHDVLAIHGDLHVGAVSQGNVQDGSVLRQTSLT